MLALGATDLALIDGWQHDFPLVARPYAEIASALGLAEGEVLAALSRLASTRVLSRVGATLRPNTAGASTLAAMCVPPERLAEVASIVSAETGVNHNYEREHDLNLWFVATGADRQSVARTLERIRRATGLEVLDLPMEQAYFIDLGFPISPDAAWKERGGRGQPRDGAVRAVTGFERDVLGAIEDGLEIAPRPYLAVAERLGCREDEIIDSLARLVADGVVSRFGLVVRHREIGFRANAMAVWDVPDADVDRAGAALSAAPFVTLCYRRPRRLPAWRYNLFCMVHGTERAAVGAHVARMTEVAGLAACAHTILFSRRCFKQRGPTLSAA